MNCPPRALTNRHFRNRIDGPLLQKHHRLLTPSAADWWETAKAIRWLYIRKAAPVSKPKTLQNDALVARLAVKHEGYVVTMDVDYFDIINREMPKLEVVPGDYFFS